MSIINHFPQRYNTIPEFINLNLLKFQSSLIASSFGLAGNSLINWIIEKYGIVPAGK